MEVGGVFAIDNVDPVSQAAVMSRGLIGSLGERVVVASPLCSTSTCAPANVSRRPSSR